MHISDPRFVIVAGAGVSVAAPSCLPDWDHLAAAIANALRQRLSIFMQNPDLLTAQLEELDALRLSHAIPPEYQAQILEEAAGVRYFEALQALDIDVCNVSHRAIAAACAAGRVKAIVTTNFDRLLERALDEAGVRYASRFTEQGFADFADQFGSGPSALPILKIHGCASQADTMIDTLKQRKRGRSKALENALDALAPAHWVYLGFSAADLALNPDYLGFLRRAPSDFGAIYVQRVGTKLSTGARMLCAAYGSQACIKKMDIESAMRSIFDVSVTEASSPLRCGQTEFKARLLSWSESLSPAAAGLCLAAVLEAFGDARSAALLVDRLVSGEIQPSEREGTDYQALQLAHGRLGASWGRFVGLNNNSSVEAIENLRRVAFETDTWPVWMVPALLWTNESANSALLVGRVGGNSPSLRLEEQVDWWLSRVQLVVIDERPELINHVLLNATHVMDLAQACGDVGRLARVAAFHMIVAALTPQDVRILARRYRNIFKEARRVGDRLARGFSQLAVGRWLVGHGGSEAREAGNMGYSVIAVDCLENAIVLLGKLGLDPWVAYARVQLLKAQTDTRMPIVQLEATYQTLDHARMRFPILASHILEVRGQVESRLGDGRATSSFRAALEAAQSAELQGRVKIIERYLA